MSFVQGPRAKATRPGGAIKMQQQAHGLCPAAQQQYQKVILTQQCAGMD